MDLAIHILTAACMVGAGVALVFAYKLVYQLEVIIERMNRRIDAMKDYEETFTDLVKRLEATQKKPLDERQRTIFSDVADALREGVRKALASPNITVEGIEPPLDFPNDRAKGEK